MSKRSDERLRRMYAGGAADRTGRRYSRVWAIALAAGLWPRRGVTLEVVGRTSGNVIRLPLGLADLDGRWYLVSMLGECNWTKNLRAAGGRATLLHLGRHPITALEVPVQERAAIIRRYVRKVPGARPHVRVDRSAPVVAFEEVAAELPVFLIDGYP